MTNLRIIPLGGVEEVGKNCTVIEYGDDIIIIDLGFDFPSSDLPGVNYILPDTKYLEKNKKRIKGLIITHGHLDHIGGISYLVKKLGYPKIYATRLTLGLIQDRLLEANEKSPEIQIIEPEKTFQLGVFKIEPFRVVHNIPDSVGLCIDTPLGKVVHTGDFKFDDYPVDQQPINKNQLKRFGKQGVLVCMSDSTNADMPGRTISEKKVGQAIDQIVKQAKSRIVFTTFSTLISRIDQVIKACQKHHRKIVVAGFSIKKTLQIAEGLGYIDIPKDIFVELDMINDYPDKKLLVLASGTQGEPRSVMTRMSKREYYSIKLKKTDTVVFSSSAIPGNELAIHKVMNGIVDQGSEIIYDPSLGLGVHSSGHACQEDQKEMLKLLKPKYFIPIHGDHYLQHRHIKLAGQVGVSKERSFMLHNGEILEITPDLQVQVLSKRIKLNVVVVEGNKVHILQEKTLQKRRRMAESGVCVIAINQNNQKKFSNKKQPLVRINCVGIIINEDILNEIKRKAQKIAQQNLFSHKLRERLENSLADFILNRTGKKPVVILI